MSLRGVVFDFDGVIANSEPLHFVGFREVLGAAGVDLAQADYYEKYLGYDDAGAFAAIAADRGLSWRDGEIEALVAKKAVRLEQLEAEQSVLFPGAADLIRGLAVHGPLAIASGALRAEIVRILVKERLDGYFELIVGAEDAEASKPSPAPYLRAVAGLAARRTGSSDPRAYVAIEDSHWGLDSARSAGLRTVAVAHTYPVDSLNADLTVLKLNELSWSKLEDLVRTA